MWQKYIAIVILAVVIGISSFKINEHKDDENKTNLAIYSSLLGASSIFLIYFTYLIWTHVSPKDKVIDAVLNDFLKIDE